MDKYNISFAGTGRVGGAVCRELFNAGHRIDLIVTRTEASGRPIAVSCNARWSSDLKFPDSTGIIIVSVPDHNLKMVLDEIRCSPGTLVLHTAGSAGLDVFPERIKLKGIFYPLQTFTHGRNVNFRDLPFLIESTDEKSYAIISSLAESLGSKVYNVDSVHRVALHMAAVFVSNFTNHMLTEGKSLAENAGFSFEILKPLINETIARALVLGPENSQTGPAIRNDINTIEKHLELLSFSPELQRLYNEVTTSIINYYNTKNKRKK